MWDSPFYVIAFVLGIVIIILSTITFILPKAKSHLFVKLLFDITYIIQMVFIFIFSRSYVVLAGIAGNFVGAIRDVAFMTEDDEERRFYWLIGLSALLIALVHFTYASPVSYLPIAGTLINTIALSRKKKRNACLLTIFGQAAFISYYILLLAESDLLTILNIIAAVMLLISAIIGFTFSLIIASRQKKLAKKQIA